MSNFISTQGRLLLTYDYYALGSIAVLTMLPFSAWLSAVIVALITLRKGWADGFKGFAVAVIVLWVLSSISLPLPAALITALMTFVPCYLTAGVLHSTASWQITAGFIVLQALCIVVLIHWLAPEFIMNQYHYVQAILKELEQNNGDNSMTNLLNHSPKQQVIANYLLGLQAVSMVLSTVTSLLLARSIQSKLFYPGGFRQEMIGFRASRVGVIFLVVAVFGAYQKNSLSVSCLPILVTYYMSAGLSLSFYLLAKDKGVSALFLLLVPLILLSFVALPMYTVLGALDSLFNFRSYLLPKADK